MKLYLLRFILGATILLVAPLIGWQLGETVSVFAQKETTSSRSPAVAPQVIKVKAEAGTQAILKSGASGEVTWVWDRRALSEKQVYEDTAKKILVITSATRVEHSITCVEYQAGKGYLQTEYLVTFEGSAPPDPDPKPDSLATDLKAAYRKDLAAGKAKVEEVRQVAAVLANAPNYLDSLKTTGEAFKVLFFALDRVVTDGDLPTVKQVVSIYLRKHIPSADVPLTKELKDRVTLALKTLAKALEEATK